MSLAERIGRGRRAIQLARRSGRDTSEWEHYLTNLFDTAGMEPTRDDGFEPWTLLEWRRVSIPQWQQTLKVSIADGDKHREDYAIWMLHDILLDPDFEEVSQ